VKEPSVRERQRICGPRRRERRRAHFHGGLAGVAIAIAGALEAPPAGACGSCRSPSGPGSAVIAPWETLGGVVAATTRYALGAYGANGRYSPFSSGGIATEELGVAVGYRPISPVEFAVLGGVAREQVHLPRFSTKQAALADSQLRLRWEPLVEAPLDLPHLPKRPSLGVALTARLPTGTVSRSGLSSGGVGSTAASQGLGAAEFALASDLRKTFARKVQIAAIAEGALRLPDQTLGLARALGPRVSGRLLALWFASRRVTAGLSVDAALEGDVRYEGARARAPASGQRSIGVSSFVGWKWESGFRGGAAVAYTPGIDGLGKNATSAIGLTVSLGFAR